MDCLEINPAKDLSGEVVAPPAKGYTLRAFFISALADGKSTIINPLIAEDQSIALNALSKFGVNNKLKDNSVEIAGVDSKLVAPEEPIFVGNSGVTMRFLASIAATANGNETTLTGDPRMLQRPIDGLVNALSSLGANVSYLGKSGFPPVKIKASTLEGGETKLDTSKSSQFLSSLLIASPLAKKDVTINLISPIKSRPYIDMTLTAMDSFGVKVEHNNYDNFHIPAGNAYMAKNYKVEGDYTSASYFFGAAAITGGKVKVKNLNPKSKQGDRQFLKVLERMGCKVRREETAIEVQGTSNLEAVEADMSNYPDVVQTLAVIAAYAHGKTVIKNIEHLRLKETDRISATVNELRRVKIQAKEFKDRIEISGGHPRGAEIETYNDHRMAMSFALMGLHTPGIRIKNPECVAKSFPNYFKELDKLRG